MITNDNINDADEINPSILMINIGPKLEKPP